MRAEQVTDYLVIGIHLARRGLITASRVHGIEA
jgi:hypothetical protein